MPALVSCLPTLFHHATAELQVTVRQGLELVAYFLVPALQERDWSPPTFGELWNQSLTRAMETNSNFTSFMLQNFDTDGDGHIGRLELLNVKDILPLHLFQGTPPNTGSLGFSDLGRCLIGSLASSFGGLAVV